MLVVLSEAKDLTERSDTGRGAGVRSFATLRTTGRGSESCIHRHAVSLAAELGGGPAGLTNGAKLAHGRLTTGEERSPWKLVVSKDRMQVWSAGPRNSSSGATRLPSTIYLWKRSRLDFFGSINFDRRALGRPQLHGHCRSAPAGWRWRRCPVPCPGRSRSRTAPCPWRAAGRDQPEMVARRTLDQDRHDTPSTETRATDIDRKLVLKPSF